MASRTRRSTDNEPVVLTDPRAIRALAHPARLAVLEVLRGVRTLTATEAAELAGLSPSAMSYHLRALARWGIIREADSTGDARERRWRAAGKGLRIDTFHRGAEAAMGMIVARDMDRTRDTVLRFVEHGTEESDAWQRATAISHAEMSLTDDEARELSAGVEKLIEGARRPSRQRCPGERLMRITFVLVPVRSPEDDAEAPRGP